jgi:DNA-binding CsgD family transcriptional regulator
VRRRLIGEVGRFRTAAGGRVGEWDALLSQASAEAVDGGPERVEAWTATVSAWDALDRPYEASYARCRLGESLLALRRRGSAAPVLRDAQSRAVGIGADGVARLAREILARARMEEPEADPMPAGARSDRAGAADGVAGLSGRELEVLRLVAEGMTNRQIAERLFISEKTAATHVSNILGKLQAASRAQAAALLVQSSAL